LLKHQFVHGNIDFCEPVGEGKTESRGVTAELRARIRT